MLLASVVNTARRPGSNMRSTGDVERASFSALKLACASGVHTYRAVGLPSAVRVLHEQVVVVGQAREVPQLGARRRRRPLDDGLHLARDDRLGHSRRGLRLGKAMTQGQKLTFATIKREVNTTSRLGFRLRRFLLTHSLENFSNPRNLGDLFARRTIVNDGDEVN
jgi:hypothetical protein